MRFWMVVLSFFSFAVLAAPLPAIKTTCVDETKPVPWTYCKTVTEGSTNGDILYHFHGKGGNAKTWTDTDYYTIQIRKEWASRGQQPPTVVSISFGPVWLLVEKNKSPASGLFEVFTQVVMPTVEKSLPQFSGRRLLVGESMGGFNASQVALKAGEQFNRVAILCPPMVELSPFASQQDIQAFVTAYKARPELVAQMIQISQHFMPEASDWNKHSPLLLAPTNLTWRSPKLYVSCGLYDEWGFFPGAERFAEIAEQRGARVQWRPIYGGHCATDIKSLAAFLR
jgi:S-formylglutathione hydrolase FrmB